VFKSTNHRHRGISESHARHLLHHLVEVGQVCSDEGCLGPLLSMRLPVRDLFSGRRDCASLAFRRCVWVGATGEKKIYGGAKGIWVGAFLEEKMH
jgi:hypothetical protein